MRVVIPTHFSKEEKKKAYVLAHSMSQVVHRGAEVSLTSDDETDVISEVVIESFHKDGCVCPMFDLEYRLRPENNYHRMSWKGDAPYYEACVAMYAFLLAARPKVVVEMSTGNSLSTIHIAKALTDMDRGSLYTFDTLPASVERITTTLADFKLGECANIVLGRAEDIVPKWTSKQIDMLFLNFSRTQYQIKPEELRKILAKVRMGGYVVTSGDYKTLPVEKPEEGPDYQWATVTFPLPEGLNIHQKVLVETPKADTTKEGSGEPKAKKKAAKPKPKIEHVD